MLGNTAVLSTLPPGPRAAPGVAHASLLSLPPSLTLSLCLFCEFVVMLVTGLFWGAPHAGCGKRRPRELGSCGGRLCIMQGAASISRSSQHVSSLLTPSCAHPIEITTDARAPKLAHRQARSKPRCRDRRSWWARVGQEGRAHQAARLHEEGAHRTRRTPHTTRRRECGRPHTHRTRRAAHRTPHIAHAARRPPASRAPTQPSQNSPRDNATQRSLTADPDTPRNHHLMLYGRDRSPTRNSKLRLNGGS